MLFRKMISDFFIHGHITSTEKRVKAIQPVVEKISHKLKTRTEANKNVILRYIPEGRRVSTMFETVGTILPETNGGYTRIKKLPIRFSDSTPMGKLEWAHTQKEETPSTGKVAQLEPKEEKPAKEKVEVKESEEKPNQKKDTKQMDKKIEETDKKKSEAVKKTKEEEKPKKNES